MPTSQEAGRKLQGFETTEKAEENFPAGDTGCSLGW
jgi:hypothetical protein